MEKRTYAHMAEETEVSVYSSWLVARKCFSVVDLRGGALGALAPPPVQKVKYIY